MYININIPHAKIRALATSFCRVVLPMRFSNLRLLCRSLCARAVSSRPSPMPLALCRPSCTWMLTFTGAKGDGREVASILNFRRYSRAFSRIFAIYWKVRTYQTREKITIIEHHVLFTTRRSLFSLSCLEAFAPSYQYVCVAALYDPLSKAPNPLSLTCTS